MKKLLALSTALIILSCVIISCVYVEPDQGTPGDSQTVGSSNTESVAETDTETYPISSEDDSQTNPPEDNIYAQNDGLANTDFQGMTLVYLVADGLADAETTALAPEDSQTDAISAAAYKRTLYVEERFNAVIASELVPFDNAAESINNMVFAGDNSYHAFYNEVSRSFMQASLGVFTDLNNIKELGFDQPWWDQNAREDLSFAGRLYYMLGDANMVFNDYTPVIYFSKDILTDNAIESPYELVSAGAWTVEKMFAMGTSAVKDLNGDNKITTDKDRFGMVLRSGVEGAFLSGCGQFLLTKGNGDTPFVTKDKQTLQKACENIAALFNQSNFMSRTSSATIYQDSDETKNALINKRALFVGESLRYARRFNDAGIDFGILPFPKYSETQTDYISESECIYAVAVPGSINNSELEFAGIILEAMQSASHGSVLKAYTDAALIKNGNEDDESAEMLEIILSSRRYPTTSVYNFSDVFTGIVQKIIGGEGGYAEYVAKRSQIISAEIESFVKNYSEHY